MIKLTQTIPDPNNSIVTKLIFESDDAIAEVVVYKYNNRGVICFSVQSGCHVGCVFCGTGKRFIRNLTREEMELQIDTGLEMINDMDKIQIMSMSMGEPLLNFDSIPIVKYLDMGYYFFVSSVGISGFDYGPIYTLCQQYDKFGMQFSLHHWDNNIRRKLLGNYEQLLDIDDLVEIAKWYKITCGRPLYFNYIATGKETDTDIGKLYDTIKHGHLTVSVLCSKHLQLPDDKPAKRLCTAILNINPSQSIKMFNPEGQDTIGGGCGQLIYVQEKFKEIQK